MAIDFSDLGGTPVEEKKGIDFSDLGGVPVVSPSETGKSLLGFLSNAGKDVGSTVEAVRRLGQGVIDLPADLYQSGKQIIEGGPAADTPIGQDVKTVGSAALAALPHIVSNEADGAYRLEPGAIYRQYENIVAQPLKYLPGVGKDFKNAYPENPFYEHPVNTAIALSPLAKPAINAAAEIPGVSAAAETVGNAIAKPLQGAAQNFGRRALGLTKKYLNKNEGQLAQANQAAQTALDQGVITNPITHPFSSGAEDMFSRAQALDASSGQKIGSFLKTQNAQFDWGKTLEELDAVKRRFPADPDVAARIDNVKQVIRNTAIRNGGEIPFEEANKIKSYIQNKVPWQSDKATADVARQAAGTIRSSIDRQLEDVTPGAGGAKAFQDFRTNKRLFGDAQTMQEGLLNKRAAESGNLPVSPYSLVTATAEFARTGDPIKALMIAGGTELAKRYGSATAATTANWLANLFRSNPAKYGSLLQTAIQTGGPTLTAISAALNAEPEFQQVIQQIGQPRKIFRKAADAGTVIQGHDGRQYAFVPGQGGSLTALDRQTPRPLFENRKRVGAKVIAAARG